MKSAGTKTRKTRPFGWHARGKNRTIDPIVQGPPTERWAELVKKLGVEGAKAFRSADRLAWRKRRQERRAKRKAQRAARRVGRR